MSHPEIKTFHFVDTVFNFRKDRLEKIAGMIASANRYGAELRTLRLLQSSLIRRRLNSSKRHMCEASRPVRRQ